MYCPNCGTGFSENVTVCTDCGATLTTDPPPGPAAQYVEWVTVLADRDYGRTGLAESLLQSEGIEYAMEGENTRWAELNEPVRVCVHPNDVERARDTLRELLEGDDEE